MNIRKLSFILTTAVLLIATACSGAFLDPGMLDQPGGGGGGNGGTVYTVTFNINGGIGTAPDPIRAKKGSSITLPYGIGFYKSGYTFGGWNTNSYGNGTTYKAGASYTVTGNVTLYAVWKIPPTISDETNPIPLTSNTWYHGNITSESPNREAWFSFNVTTGTTYYVWWNDSFSGYGKTLDIKVYASYNYGSNIFTEIDSAWDSPRSFTASSTGTVKLRVCPWNSNLTGTFDIAYNTSGTRPYAPVTVTFNINGGSGTTPSSQTVNCGSSITLPDASEFSKSGYILGGWNTNFYGNGTTYKAGASYTVTGNVTLYAKWNNNSPGSENNPLPLTIDTWTDGEIKTTTNNREIWYSFNVATGTTYYVWWNDSFSGYGKTLDVAVDAYYNPDSSIFTKRDSAWTIPVLFTASSTDTVKLRVCPCNSSNSIGTFAIAYNTSDTRPYVPVTVTFNINGGNGNTPSSQTVNYGSSITLPDASEFSKSGYILGGWATATTPPRYYSAGASYTVNSNITFNAVWISVLTGSGTETDPYQLTENTWADGVITSSTANKEVWYSFAVTNEVTYNIWWNDHFDGDGTKTLSAYVDVSYSNGSPIFTEDEDKDTAWDSPKQFTANSTGTVKLKVYPYNYTTGTFAIVFSQSITRP